MMEAARTFETLVNFYQTTRRYNLEDSHLRTHRRENLKSYIYIHTNDLTIQNKLNLFLEVIHKKVTDNFQSLSHTI
jgi:hypothetical protein